VAAVMLFIEAVRAIATLLLQRHLFIYPSAQIDEHGSYFIEFRVAHDKAQF